MCKGLPIISIPVMLILCSCSSSRKITKIATEDITTYNLASYPCRFYDDGTKIRYDFRTEANNLYVIVQTDNDAAKRRIMGPGLKIFVGNKKSEDNYFLFPVHRGGENTMAAYVDHGRTEYFDINQNKYNVSYTFENKSDGFLTYIFKLPYNKQQNKDLVVGIMAPDADRNRATHGTATTAMHAGGGMHSGGMHGGMHGGSGMHGAGRSSQNDGNESTINKNRDEASGRINWWFKIS